MTAPQNHRFFFSILVAFLIAIIAIFIFRDLLPKKIVLNLSRLENLGLKNNYKCHPVLETSIVDEQDQVLGKVSKADKADYNSITVNLAGDKAYLDGAAVVYQENQRAWDIVTNNNERLIATYTQQENLMEPAFVFILNKKNGIAFYGESYIYKVEYDKLVNRSLYLKCQ